MGSLDPLREEHRELAAGLQELKHTAELADSAPFDRLVEGLEINLHFLTERLLPHAEAEEHVLYRAYDQVANSPWATDTLRRDHAEVARLIQELGALRREAATAPLTQAVRQEVQRLLYGLHALLGLHFGHEETLLLPRLEEGLSPEAAHQLLHSLEEHGDGHQAA